MEPLADTPSIDDFARAREELGDRVRTTPVWRWQGLEIEEILGAATEVHLKLELFQFAGTFKPRGALLNMLALPTARLRGGVTAVSAGNHAMAVGYAASRIGCSAKVVMPQTAEPMRVAACRKYGAEVVLVADVYAAFDEVERIQRDERRALIHPFEGRRTILGTGTVGLELCRAVPGLDAVIVPIGGGGLCAGVATAVRQLQPACRVFGVEPEGADTMHRSFAAGSPQTIERIGTIADSLGAPRAEPYSFGLCRRFVERLVKISDAEMVAAMQLMFREAKLAVEPAGAAAVAALVGPLRDELRGLKVALIVCGSNIHPETWFRMVAPGLTPC